MSTKKGENKPGLFEGLLTMVGLISGGVFGYEHGEWIGMILAGVIVGGIGNWIGRVADWLVKIAVLIVFLMLNAVIRRFIFEFIQALISGG